MAHPLSGAGHAQAIVALDIGFWLADQVQGLGCVNIRGRPLCVHQPVQKIDDMGLAGNASFQRQLNGREDGLLIMLQNQRQDIDHLAVATKTLEQMPLQAPKASGISVKGAPLRKAPGLRWMTAR
jgi:hypothetical protein